MLFNGKNFTKGKYVPDFPEKCLNYNGKCLSALDITYRSSWEKRVCYWCDHNKNVIEWSSETYKIKYFNTQDKKEHEYIVDFYIKTLGRDNKIHNFLIEIKPDNQSEHLDNYRRTNFSFSS